VIDRDRHRRARAFDRPIQRRDDVAAAERKSRLKQRGLRLAELAVLLVPQVLPPVEARLAPSND
jgi:hypothetical protein